jgi:uncharacterized glyoxalase superfamily protein PhnB
MEPDTVTSPSTSWIPDDYTSITPYLCVEGGADAIVFYTTVFGAEVVGRNDGPNGTVAHAELQFSSGRIQLSDPAPDHNLRPPSGEDVVTHSYVHYCPDVDATYAAALAAGAKGYGEPETFEAPIDVKSESRISTAARSWGSVARCFQAGWRRSLVLG